MAAVLLLIGLILIIAAVRGTHGTLFGALGQDVPAFFVWGAAIVAVASLGFVPGLRTISRGLLALILVVIVTRNYQAILSGFQNAGIAASATPSPAPGGSQQTSVSDGLSIVKALLGGEDGEAFNSAFTSGGELYG